MWNLIVYRGATLYPLRHRADIGTRGFLYRPHWSMLSFRGHWFDSHDEFKSFKMNYFRSVRPSISLRIGPILYDICPLTHLPSLHQRMQPVCPILCLYFHYWVWRDLNEWIHSRLWYIICFEKLCLFPVLFILELWYNTVFVYKVPPLLSDIKYDCRERHLFNPPSACLPSNNIGTYLINSIIIYTIFVSLILTIAQTSRSLCIWSETPNSTKHVLCRQYTSSPLQYWYDHALPMTEAWHLDATSAYDKAKYRSDIANSWRPSDAHMRQ